MSDEKMYRIYGSPIGYSDYGEYHGVVIIHDNSKLSQEKLKWIDNHLDDFDWQYVKEDFSKEDVEKEEKEGYFECDMIIQLTDTVGVYQMEQNLHYISDDEDSKNLWPAERMKFLLENYANIFRRKPAIHY